MQYQLKSQTIKNEMTVGYCDTRSICKKEEETQMFLADNKLDLCAITETWIPPAGYHLDHVSRKTGKGGRVAIIHRSLRKGRKQKVCRHSSFDIIEMLFMFRADAVHICVIYRKQTWRLDDSIYE